MTALLLFLGVMIVLGLLVAGLTAVCWLQIHSFLRNHAAITGERDMVELKQVVKVNMYAALGMIAIAGAMVVVAVAAVALGVIGVPMLLVGLAVIGGLFGIGGGVMKAAEHQLRNLPLEDPGLRSEHEHVLRRWTSSAFPDW